MLTQNPFLPIFRKPAVIVSILVLIINDHFLKQTYPSWFTGKISDFAGLFFFPFLAAFLFSIVYSGLTKKQLPAAKGLTVTILLCLVIFSGIKLFPPFNQTVINIIHFLTGFSLSIVCDPSDLIALISLLGCWVFWKQTQTRISTPQLPSKTAWGVFSLAVVASIATSPAPPPPMISMFLSMEDSIYVTSTETYGEVFRYTGNNLWEKADLSADLFLDQNNSYSVSTEKTICLPQESSHCYRIRRQPFVEESLDAGVTWNTAWEIPSGRITILTRLDVNHQVVYTPVDLVYIPEEQKLLVSLGNQGFLVLEKDGPWHQIPFMVKEADQQIKNIFTPININAKGLKEAVLYIKGELYFIFSMAVLVLSVFSDKLWKFTYQQIIEENIQLKKWKKKVNIVRFILFFILVINLFLICLFYPDSMAYFNPFLMFIFPLTFICLFFLYLNQISLWKKIFAGNQPKHSTQKLLSLVLINQGLTITLPILIFLMWAYGLITAYSAAVFFSLLFIFVVFLITNNQIKKRFKNQPVPEI